MSQAAAPAHKAAPVADNVTIEAPDVYMAGAAAATGLRQPVPRRMRSPPADMALGPVAKLRKDCFKAGVRPRELRCSRPGLWAVGR